KDGATESRSQDEDCAPEVAASSDWLFGGDDLSDAVTTTKPEQKSTQEEVLDEPGQTTVTPEISSMEESVEASDKDNDVFRPEKADNREGREPFSVMVTAPSMDVDVLDGTLLDSPASPGSEKADSEKGKRHEGDAGTGATSKRHEGDAGTTATREMIMSVGSDISDKVDSRTSSTSEIDMDFSILELPGTAHLNFDVSNHKRTLSKKGSISRRKKPTRAAIHTSKLASSEDSIFIDST
ncbi:hypothetical protein EGW08_012483, partial [Elysia chlorotica]